MDVMVTIDGIRYRVEDAISLGLVADPSSVENKAASEAENKAANPNRRSAASK